MNIINKFNQLAGEPDLTTVLESVINKVGLDLNCIRVGIIQSFNADDLTATVSIVNKRTLGLNKDGTQKTRDYALVTAKVCYCTPYMTYPIEPGEECILLFSDRELESWFTTGEVQPEAYQRMHDLTDCIAIVGLRSLAKMITILADTLHLFYGESDIQIKDKSITSNTTNFDVNATSSTLTIPTITATGTLTAHTLNAQTGASASFYSGDNPRKTITVTNGIITNITPL